MKQTKIQEAKENVMKNFRSNYTNDHQSTHDIEIFLLNTMEQFEVVVKRECKNIITKWKNDGENPTETDLVLENILKEI
jgi:hypothetical protein